MQSEVWGSRSWDDFVEIRGKYLTLSAILEFREITHNKLEELIEESKDAHTS